MVGPASWLASGWLFAGASVADCACKPAEQAANASIVGKYFIWISISVCLRSGLWRRKVGSCNKVRSLPFPTPVSTGSGSKGSFLCSCKETSQTQTRSPLRKDVRKEGGLLPCQPRIRTEYGCVVEFISGAHPCVSGVASQLEQGPASTAALHAERVLRCLYSNKSILARC